MEEVLCLKTDGNQGGQIYCPLRWTGWSYLNHLSRILDAVTRGKKEDAYLFVRDGSDFCHISSEVARSCKNDAIWCHTSVEQPLFEMKVYIWAGEDRGSHTSICFASCRNAQWWTVCQFKMSSGVSWLPVTSVLSFHPSSSSIMEADGYSLLL